MFNKIKLVIDDFRYKIFSMRRLFFLIIFSFLFVSCKTIPIVAEIMISLGNEVQQSNPKNEETSQKTTVDSIRQKVLEYAYMYCNSDTEYAWGGQDMIRSIKVDCSGMVINCYKYAIKGTKYKLPFDDTTSSLLFSKYTTGTTDPQPGDLIFMGDSGSNSVNHVGIFVKFDSKYVYFIDSTNGEGVSQRKYLKTNKVIKGYGVMKLN